MPRRSWAVRTGWAQIVSTRVSRTGAAIARMPLRPIAVTVPAARARRMIVARG
jgi:hypothetical protein